MTPQEENDSGGMILTVDGVTGYFPKEFIVTAIELRMRKKVKFRKRLWAECPKCGGSVYLWNVLEHIMDKETTYCEHCGQALDWSDEK